MILYRQDRLIASAAYYQESELYRHYANPLHDGFASDFTAFRSSNRGLALGAMTRLRYAYLFTKLALRYRRLG